MNHEHLISSYESWLSERRWVLFGTLTFRGFPSHSRAVRLFHQWISEMQQSDGTNKFAWVRVTELGAFRDNIHFHVLIGGLRDGCKWPWLLRWDEIAGSADIFYYRPDAGGLRYILKEARPDHDFDIEISLP